MAEAEDVITDVARHATVNVRDLWRRHRPPAIAPEPLRLADVAKRLDLLIAAVFGRSIALRVAQPPAPPTWLGSLFVGRRLPQCRLALPATDGESIWLPATFGSGDTEAVALERFRTVAMQQAMRVVRGSAEHRQADQTLLQRELYLLLEARAADDALARLLPGMVQPLCNLREYALHRRPVLAAFSAPDRLLEELVRRVLRSPPVGDADAGASIESKIGPLPLPADPGEVLGQASRLCALFPASEKRGKGRPHVPRLVWRDAWLGDLREPAATSRLTGGNEEDPGFDDAQARARSVRLTRRPEVRDKIGDEDDRAPGAWMVQPAQPHEQAEDPMGLQRPTDRDSTTPAEDFADALSELPEARLVAAPGRPKEILLSDDPPEARARNASTAIATADAAVARYPEWDWRVGGYRDPGVTVRLLAALSGPQRWVDETLERRRGMLHEIRRRFEMLRARRERIPKQLDGDDIDLQACIESYADVRAGLPMGQRLYQSERRARRDMAIMLLVDVSGSTDGWIAADKRVIDVEREALLLVCIALDGLAEPYSVLAFSGEGPHGVVVRSVKRFDERHDDGVARRIAGLEPEHYTRAGAAIRHASALLMGQAAENRLLLLLSDGKPNDVDDYEGRYGVEDMRQAVTEARLQGISAFCLTVDRQPASYLTSVFGPHQYALLPRPELLPLALLDWLRRLVAR